MTWGFGGVHPSGFTFVGPRDLYSGTRGYGWSTRVAAADRPNAALEQSEPRPAHGQQRHVPGAGGPGGTYNVRVYLANPLGTGAYQYTYDNFDVMVEGGSTYHGGLAGPGPGDDRGLDAVRRRADDILDIQFIDRGGQNFNWVVSGIEIYDGFPGAGGQPLLADAAASAAGRRFDDQRRGVGAAGGGSRGAVVGGGPDAGPSGGAVGPARRRGGPGRLVPGAGLSDDERDPAGRRRGGVGVGSVSVVRGP